jgi:alpha-L-fucosidase
VPTWEALHARPVPSWYDDAKLGIMIHWGPYAVPAWAPVEGPLPSVVADKGWDYWFSHNPYTEWYENSVGIPGSPTHEHHKTAWGWRTHYETFARTFRQGIAGWDPSSWIDVASASRARYIVFTAKHHDGFLLWPSKKRNPRKRGWQLVRDAVGELAEAARARGLRFGLYYSSGLDWSFGGLPIRNRKDLLDAMPHSKGYADYVDGQLRELITRYKPSILWNDMRSPAGQDLLDLFSFYYDEVPDGVVNDRFGQAEPSEPDTLGEKILAIVGRIFRARERGLAARGTGAAAHPHADFRTFEDESAATDTDGKWEYVRALGCSFGANASCGDEDTPSAASLVQTLVDVVARGGNLLLGVGPGAEGSIADAQKARLQKLGEWLKVNGEAIFDSRPWGDQETVTEDDIPIRYTSRGMTTYAILLGTPKDRMIVLPSLRLLPYAGVRIIGSLGYVTWLQEGKDVHIRVTEPLRDSPAHVISITPQPRF